MSLPPVIRLLRPRQWVKNTLVIAPLFFHGDLTLARFGLSCLAFVSFCLAASAAYCLNDALDYRRDQQHPEKKHRPVASGLITPPQAVMLSGGLMIASLVLARELNPAAMIVVLIYAAVQILYSIKFKRIPTLDVVVLSMMYVLRVIFGAAALAIQPSSWILVCCGLLALMLAFGKRFSELKNLGTQTASREVLLTYSADFLSNCIGATGGAALVCYLLWCNEGISSSRFTQLQILPSGILVAYGILRYQQVLLAGRFGEDPTLDIFRHKDLLLGLILFVIYLGVLMYASSI